MFLRIQHLSRYTYAQPVAFAPHALYLRPRETPRQRLHEFSLSISPAPRRVATSDAGDNALEWAYFEPGAMFTELEFRTESLVETLDSNPFDFFLSPSALNFPFAYTPAERHVLAPSLLLPDGSDPAQLNTWLASHFATPPTDTVSYLTALNTAVRSALSYNRREEPGIQSPAQTLALGTGTCRDYAVFFIALCRHLGLAARFVSGYVYDPPTATIPNPLPPDLHAWAEVYLPGAGWRGLDPTRAIFCDDAYVPLAHAALAESVNPIQGNFVGGAGVASNLHTSLTLTRL
ncbi:MAG: transglutaminase family protein [Verrucomicrobia bacterium]|nr:transglutaminase family protein [Verrucomicrobiota bacterium]